MKGNDTPVNVRTVVSVCGSGIHLACEARQFGRFVDGEFSSNRQIGSRKLIEKMSSGYTASQKGTHVQ